MDGKAILEVKPVIVPLQYFIGGPVLAGFISIFPAFFTFVISNMILGISGGLGFDGPVISYGLIAYMVSFIALMFFIYLKIFVEPTRTTYSIYDDHIEYYEGFLNRNRRTLLYDQVIDVQLAEGILQQTKNAGTITLITQQLVESGDAKLSNRRISLRNVPNPQELYEVIRSSAKITK